MCSLCCEVKGHSHWMEINKEIDDLYNGREEEAIEVSCIFYFVNDLISTVYNIN